MESTGRVWHAEVLSPAAEETVKHLGALESIRSFYLAGGTGLALHLGHRRSVDLDLFSQQPFDEETLLANLLPLKNLSVIARARQTLHLHINNTKVSFLGYSYPVLFPFEFFRDFAVADILDIACMKLSALASRGTRRDFVDLYVIAQTHGLAPLLEQFERKFAQVNYNKVHILKALVFFADAEKEPMPDMLIPLSWEAVKSYFLHEVLKISVT
jgi:hypothetical protein